MSAPFRIVNQYHETHVTLDKAASLDAAIKVAVEYRKLGIDNRATVHGDNVDLDCADGLSRAERETVQEALG